MKVQTSFFGAEELAVIGATLVVSLPGAFLIAHAAGVVLGLRRPLVDLLADRLPERLIKLVRFDQKVQFRIGSASLILRRWCESLICHSAVDPRVRSLPKSPPERNLRSSATQ